jgi:hypothetical protein
MFVVLASVFVGVFLREVPMGRPHDLEGEPSPAAVPSPPPVSPASEALGPVAGGSYGLGGRRPLAYAAVGAGLAFVLGLLAFIVRRNGG